MRVLCANCEGTGREYPYGERAMRCQGEGCSNGTVPAILADFDGKLVRVTGGLWIGTVGIVALVSSTWIIEADDGAWMLVSPDPDYLEIIP